MVDRFTQLYYTGSQAAGVALRTDGHTFGMQSFHLFQQVIDIAAQYLCQHDQILRLCPVDALLPLFILLNGIDMNIMDKNHPLSNVSLPDTVMQPYSETQHSIPKKYDCLDEIWDIM